MKILVIKRDKIGDMLLTTPMLAHLRTALPQAEIHVLANDYNAWVLENNPDVDRVWVYGRVRQGRKYRLLAAIRQLGMFIRLRLAKFDVAVVGNGGESARAIKRGLWVGARRSIAYCHSPRLADQLTDPLPQPEGAVHECDRLLLLLQPLGIAPPAIPAHPQYRIGQPAIAQALAWKAANGLDGKAYIVLGLGARRAKKQPSAQQIVRWARHAKQAWGLDTVLTWTPGGKDSALYPGDDQIANAVLSEGLDCIHPFRGYPVTDPAEFGASLQALLGVIWQAQGSVFPDSGLMHFAAASPGGVLGLFADVASSASPDEWAPRGENVQLAVAEHAVEELGDEIILSRLARLVKQ